MQRRSMFLMSHTIQTKYYWRTDNFLPSIKMETFRRCWKAHGNDERTSTKDSDKTEKSR